MNIFNKWMALSVVGLTLCIFSGATESFLLSIGLVIPGGYCIGMVAAEAMQNGRR